MSKQLVSVTLNFLAGLAGNLIAGWIQQDVWINLFTPARIIGTIIGVVIMLAFIAWLESDRKIPKWLTRIPILRKIIQFFRDDRKLLEILVIQSRPNYLYEMLGKDPSKVVKQRNPANITEHKPEVVTQVEPDSEVIQRAFDEVGRKVLLKTLNKATKSDLASALRDNWDIVHFDCVVGHKGQLYIEDGEIEPQILRELLAGKNIKMLVLMDCDSLKVVSSANSAGVNTLIAVTGSLPVLAAEKFCYGLYRGIARNKEIAHAFSDAKALASVNLIDKWDSTLFVLDGKSEISLLSPSVA